MTGPEKDNPIQAGGTPLGEHHIDHLAVDHSEVAMTKRATTRTPGTVKIEPGELRAHKRFDEVSIGDVIEPKTYKLTRGDLVNYSGVAGDPNPIHFSDAIAAIGGMETCVAQGMLTMGISAGYVTDWLGDPTALTSYAVRFTSPVYVPADRPASLMVSGKIKKLDAETKTGEIALVARQDDRKIFGRAIATVRFA